MNTFQVNASAVPGQQGVIEIRRDRFDGEILGKCPIEDSQSKGFKLFNTTITPVAGVQKIYLVFTGGSGHFFTITDFNFLSQ